MSGGNAWITAGVLALALLGGLALVPALAALLQPVVDAMTGATWDVTTVGT